MRIRPYEFIFEFLEREGPGEILTKPMFGHRAVYVKGRLGLFLIDRPGNPDNGICVATSTESIPKLVRELPSLRPLVRYGADATDWRLIPVDTDRFESEAIRACELLLAGDPRIGREPKSRARKGKVAGKKTAKKKH